MGRALLAVVAAFVAFVLGFAVLNLGTDPQQPSVTTKTVVSGQAQVQSLLEDFKQARTVRVRDPSNQPKLVNCLKLARVLVDSWDGYDRLGGEPTNSANLVNLIDNFVAEVDDQVSPNNPDFVEIKKKLEEGKKNLPPPPVFVPATKKPPILEGFFISHQVYLTPPPEERDKEVIY